MSVVRWVFDLDWLLPGCDWDCLSIITDIMLQVLDRGLSRSENPLPCAIFKLSHHLQSCYTVSFPIKQKYITANPPAEEMHTLNCHYSLGKENIICPFIVWEKQGSPKLCNWCYRSLTQPDWFIENCTTSFLKPHQPSVRPQDPSAAHHRAMQQQWLNLHIQNYRHPRTRRQTFFFSNQHCIHGWGLTLYLYKSVSHSVWNLVISIGPYLYLSNSCFQGVGGGVEAASASGKNNSQGKMSHYSIPLSNWTFKPCSVVLLWQFPC